MQCARLATMTVAPPSRRRISWDQVPSHVRGAVDGTLGAAVEEAITQHGGFSPGAAVRLRLTNGRKAFVNTEPFLRDHPTTRAVESSSIDAVLMALAANYWWMSRQPGPEWLPGTRAHQLACAEATLSWLQRRIT